MKILADDITMAARNTLLQSRTTTTEVHFWRGARPTPPGTEQEGTARPPQWQDYLADISRRAREQATRTLAPAAKSETASPAGLQEMSDDELPPELLLLKLVMEKVFHKKMKIFRPTTAGDAQPAAAPAAEGAGADDQWGLEVRMQETRYQKESVEFAAAGRVITADGREMAFDLQFSMSRETMQTMEVVLQAGSAARRQDPLAVDLSGLGIRLDGTPIRFDLDGDGQVENIAAPTAGKGGFLALDRNGNGVIDNGVELFGPQSGNGFNDLRALDDDRNGWIDENDAAYSRLQVWNRDASGRDVTSSLAAAGIGALNLQSANTRMEMEGGLLRESGVYLQEDGRSGLLQEVDVNVS